MFKTGFHGLNPAVSYLEAILKRAITVLLAEIEILCELRLEDLYILGLCRVIDQG